MSNFPFSYKLSWLPRLLKPSLAGRKGASAPTEARWSEPRESVRLVFLGDISAVANRAPPEIDTVLRSIIEAADLVVGNCESPVVEKPRVAVTTRLGLRHAMTPDFLDGVLAAAAIRPERLVLSLANNHALDQGVAAFEETAALLTERGIRTIGTTADGLVRRIGTGGLNIGFLAFTRWRNADAREFTGRVTMTDTIDGWDEGIGGTDLVCALPHWDFEFRHFPQAGTRALARRLAGEGVRVIVGGHAHVVQPVERIGETLVAYGLGDFLGTALPLATWPLRIGAVLVVEVSADAETKGRIAAYRIAPFLRERRGRHERLVPLEAAAGPVGEKARRRIATLFNCGGQVTQKSL